MTVTFVLPLLNEEASLPGVLDEIHDAVSVLASRDMRADILIVDGGSTDRSVELARAGGARVISAPRGYGRQYRAGFRAATGDVIVTGDTDGTYPLHEAPRLIDELVSRNLDFLTTDRFFKLEHRSMSLLHHLGNRFLSWCVRFLFSVPLHDSQSGMWVLRKSALPHLSLKNDDMAFSQELKLDAFACLRAGETGINYRMWGGTSKLRTFTHGFRNLHHLLKRRFSAPSLCQTDAKN